MSLSSLNTNLEEALAPFASSEHDPFDTPEAKARTAFGDALLSSMNARLAAERQRRAAADGQVVETQG